MCKEIEELKKSIQTFNKNFKVAIRHELDNFRAELMKANRESESKIMIENKELRERNVELKKYENYYYLTKEMKYE